MRRRRQKNTLLPKTIGVAVVITAILLPILAQLGAFKNIGGQKLTQVELIKLPPPEKRPPPPKKVAKKPTAKPKAAGHKAAARAASRRAPSGPPPVKVVAAGPSPGASGGGGGDAGITGSDTGATPSVPPPPAPPAPAAPPSPPPAPAPPPPAPPAPKLAPPAPLPAPPPVITAAVPVSQPKPSIPDDLRDSDLNASFNALFTIQADGSASVRMVSSTGNPALDALALDAAKRWTFRPATRNGQPVQSFLRLRVEFDVTS
jgi:protein TonB